MKAVFALLWWLGVACAQGPVFTTLYEFKGGADGSMAGSMPNGITIGKNGRLYGTTYAGGTNSCGSYFCGTIYELTPSSETPWTKTVLHDFNGADGALPDANLVFGGNGALYGTTQAGGTLNNGGTVFELAPPAVSGGSWSESVLTSFNGVWNEPHTPYGGVVIGPNGALYGTTYANWCWLCGPEGTGNETGGTVFMLTPPGASDGTWTQYTLYSFWPIDTSIGVDPFAGLTKGDGAIYGTTSLTSPGVGGGCGSVYQVSPPVGGTGPWITTAIHSFGSTSGDGCSPGAPVVADSSGALYGTTFNGGLAGSCHNSGAGGCGVLFQLIPPSGSKETWTENIIYSFTGVNGDGSLPWQGRLVVGGNGVLYGTTRCGGNGPTATFCTEEGVTGSGTVFSLTPPTTPGGAWTETILHNFTGGTDGAVPVAGLALGPNGVLYGTASQGGSSGNGMVFSIKP